MIGIQVNLLRPQKLRRILEKAPFVLLLSLWCSAMYLDDSDSTNCYSSLHFHELLWWQGEVHYRIRSKEAHVEAAPLCSHTPHHHLLKSLWRWWVQYVFFSSTTFSSSTQDSFFFDRKGAADAVTWNFPTVTFPTLWKAPRSSAFQSLGFLRTSVSIRKVAFSSHFTGAFWQM